MVSSLHVCGRKPRFGSFLSEESKHCKAQSGEGSKDTVEEKSTTTFHSGAATQEGPTEVPMDRLSVYQDKNSDISSFLSKPIQIAVGQWTTTMTENYNLLSFDIGQLLFSNDIWFQKIKGFNLIKGTFKVKVALNTSPFQQGKLILHYLPCYLSFTNANPNWSKMYNKKLVQKVQRPHIELDCTRTEATYSIPYVAPTAMYDIYKQSYDWGRVFLDVFSPLKTGSAAPAGQLYADYAVYGWFENVQLAAPVVPQSGRGKGKIIRRASISENKEDTHKISDTFSLVGSVAKDCESVPVIGDIARPVAWASNWMGKLANIWGYSKPISDEKTSNQQINAQRYHTNADGASNAISFATFLESSLEDVDYASWTNEDEMSMSFLKQVPYYHGSLLWTSTAGQGSSLLNMKLIPYFLRQQDTDTIATHTASYDYNSYFSYFSHLFELYRGAFKVKLKIVKTKMHSGRLLITWTPTQDMSTSVTLSNSVYSLRCIADIREAEEIELNLPYLLSSDFIDVGNATGTLDIKILNDLRGPESVSQDVYIQVFITAGDDFEFAVPKVVSGGFISAYLPQSSVGEKVLQSNSADVILEESIGDTSKDSSNLFHAKRCIGEKIESIRVFLNKKTTMQCQNGVSLNAARFIPHSYCMTTLTSGGIMTGVVGNDAYTWFAPLYAFFRGSVIFSYTDISSTGRVLTTFTPTQNTGVIFPIASSSTVQVATISNYSPSSTTLRTPLVPTVLSNDVSSVCEIKTPYYSKYPFSLNIPYDGIYSGSNETSPYSGITIYSTVVSNPVLSRAIGEDFRFSFFLGFPPTCTAYI